MFQEHYSLFLSKTLSKFVNPLFIYEHWLLGVHSLQAKLVFDHKQSSFSWSRQFYTRFDHSIDHFWRSSIKTINHHWNQPISLSNQKIILHRIRDKKDLLIRDSSPLGFIQLHGYSPLNNGSKSSFLQIDSSWFD